ncbi:hypothetical protein J0J26_20640 [Vibrio vulnificus]|uniref:hypothetical protein n=1 Tax=Vibrio vulnificus TaxID=672 RepID=UPI0019D49BDF|nr:hypothetical protein [Vibrio vulnificus]EHZ7344576.1 hypothetical protein [Vibrio vulnificus]MBN8090473.1 hypothetical protein [Vibrio vulnificus]MBN8119342.1 hypothetical protein [Vibrio vulnificus]
MNFEASEHLESAEQKAQQLTAIAIAAGESAQALDQTTLALCLQVIERLGRECSSHIASAETMLSN